MTRLYLLTALTARRAVLQVTTDGWRLDGEPVPEGLVATLLADGHVTATRKPVVSGTPLTGRVVLTKRGERYARIMGRRAA